MGPCHSETGYPGGMGYDYIEGSRDKLLDVWLHALCWIGGSWMVQPIYESTSVIDIKIGLNNQAGKE